MFNEFIAYVPSKRYQLSFNYSLIENYNILKKCDINEGYFDLYKTYHIDLYFFKWWYGKKTN